jgi:hypothetical protein
VIHTDAAAGLPAARVVVPRFPAQGDPTMARGNFNSQSKRARELAKKDKRAAKDQKREQKKADARATRAAAVGKLPSTPPGATATELAGASNVRSPAAAGE